ncbi:MAG TPA: GNAT family N-acetyltransferase [Polyangia bacterium]|nr:GNAT family N-acetyltransferase [Polyangia bacterium]
MRPGPSAREIVIRPATGDDRPVLEGLWREVDALHARLEPAFFQEAPGHPRSASFIAEALQSPDQTVLLAVASGAPVGLVHVQLYDTPPLPTMVPRRRAHIEDLVVTRSHRRRGIGRKLMAAATEWARAGGAVEIVLTVWEGNQTAGRFYHALGYRALSRTLKIDL